MQCDILCKISEQWYSVTYGYWMAILFKTRHINTSCDVLFKTLVKVTWKWVIYYTADALKSYTDDNIEHEH